MAPTTEVNTMHQPEVKESKQDAINAVIKETKNDLKSQFQNFIDDVTGVFKDVVSKLKSFFGFSPETATTTTKTSTEKESTKSTNTVTATPEQENPLTQEALALLKQPLMQNVPGNKEQFAVELCALAHYLQTRPEWLLVVMYNESHLKPWATNQSSDSTGIIQWMPDTARGLGTSTDALRSMSATQQLAYVKKYCDQFHLVGKLNTLEDVYLAIFFPKAIGHAHEPGYVFQTKNLGSRAVALANPIFDLNKDGKITMAEFKSFVQKNMASKLENVPSYNATFLA